MKGENFHGKILKKLLALFLTCCLLGTTALPAFSVDSPGAPSFVVESEDIFDGVKVPTVIDENGNAVDSTYEIIPPEKIEAEAASPSFRANLWRANLLTKPHLKHYTIIRPISRQKSIWLRLPKALYKMPLLMGLQP